MTIRIEEKSKITTFLNIFDVSPEKADALAASLAQHTQLFMSRQAGFIGAAVHVSEDKTRVVNYAQWRGRAEMAVALSSAESSVHLSEIRDLARQITPAFYDVAFVSEI